MYSQEKERTNDKSRNKFLSVPRTVVLKSMSVLPTKLVLQKTAKMLAYILDTHKIYGEVMFKKHGLC